MGKHKTEEGSERENIPLSFPSSAAVIAFWYNRSEGLFLVVWSCNVLQIASGTHDGAASNKEGVVGAPLGLGKFMEGEKERERERESTFACVRERGDYFERRVA